MSRGPTAPTPTGRHRSRADEPARSREAREPDGGSVTVELALIVPLLAVVLIGMVTSGLVLVRQLSLESAARDAARSGAVIPFDEPPPGMTWIQAVEGLARSATEDGLPTGAVCVALVDAQTGLPVLPSLTTKLDGTACFAEQVSDDLRVQVTLAVPGRIDGAFFAYDILIDTRASARYELPRPVS